MPGRPHAQGTQEQKTCQAGSTASIVLTSYRRRGCAWSECRGKLGWCDCSRRLWLSSEPTGTYSNPSHTGEAMRISCMGVTRWLEFIMSEGCLSAAPLQTCTARTSSASLQGLGELLQLKRCEWQRSGLHMIIAVPEYFANSTAANMQQAVAMTPQQRDKHLLGVEAWQVVGFARFCSPFWAVIEGAKALFQAAVHLSVLQAPVSQDDRILDLIKRSLSASKSAKPASLVLAKLSVCSECKQIERCKSLICCAFAGHRID